MTASAPAYKSKTLATWIALIGGSVGLHRFYLHGFRDRLGWLFVLPTLLGVYGVQRMRHLGADDHLAWALALNAVWMAGAVWLFAAQFRQARLRGALLSIGE